MMDLENREKEGRKGLMKTKRHIVVVLMVLMLLVLMPGISIQAKSKMIIIKISHG